MFNYFKIILREKNNNPIERKILKKKSYKLINYQ